MRILLVEGRPSDAVSVRTWLAADPSAHHDVLVVTRLDDGLQVFAESTPDVVLLDLHLPDSEGLISLERMVVVAGSTPVLVMTEDDDPELEERALRLGAADLIAKARVSGVGLSRALRNATRRAALQGRLRRSQESFRAIVERSGDGLVVCSGGGEVLYANPSALVFPGLQGTCLEVLKAPGTGDVECTLQTRGGAERVVLVSRSVTTWDGRTAGLLSFRDVTLRRAAEAETRRREERSQQSQRLGGLGRLAGGIAHEFNNLLMVIRGHAELLEARSDDARIHRHARHITTAADRSTAIARQLMVFASRDRASPEELDLVATLEASVGSLRKLLGEDIALVLELGAERPGCRLIPGQLEQLLVNLVSNARDAIDGAGRVTLRLDPHERDGQRGVRLVLADDGSGMSPDTLARALEPFFTTKEVGAGTGLGLSAVYGIVSQAGGDLGLESELGEGTRVSVWLPTVAAATALEPPRVAPSRTAESALVLVAEDEPTLRQIVVTALARAGHELLEAGSPGEALGLPADQLARVQVLVSDYAMPGGNGLQLYEQLVARGIRPGFVLVSGYTRGARAARTDLPPGAVFLQKPFSLKELAAAVDGQLQRLAPQGVD